MTRFTEQLRVELVAAAERDAAGRRRPVRWRDRRAGRVLVAVAAALAAVVGWTTLAPAPVSAGVEVRFVAGRLEVRLVDLEHRPDVIEDALEEAGLDVRVIAVPVSPSLVGKVVGQSEAPGLVPLDGPPNAAGGFAVPADYDGRLEILVGRPAEPGEGYHAGGNAYAAGEPLSCLGVFRATASEAAARATDAGVRVDFRPFTGSEVLELIPAAAVASSPYADWIAVDANAMAPDRAIVMLTADGTTLNAHVDPDELGRCRE